MVHTQDAANPRMTILGFGSASDVALLQAPLLLNPRHFSQTVRKCGLAGESKRAMKTRKLGPSDLDLTLIGFGAWAIGGGDWQFGWGSQEDADSIAAIHRALELGINWIDTAAVYGLGHSEQVVAKALAQWS